MEETEKLDELLNETMETTTNEEDEFSQMLKEFIDSALEDKTEETQKRTRLLRRMRLLRRTTTSTLTSTSLITPTAR